MVGRTNYAARQGWEKTEKRRLAAALKKAQAASMSTAGLDPV